MCGGGEALREAAFGRGASVWVGARPEAKKMLLNTIVGWAGIWHMAPARSVALGTGANGFGGCGMANRKLWHLC